MNAQVMPTTNVTDATARPAFGTLLASQMAVALLEGRQMVATRVPQVRDARTVARHPCAALRQRLLRGLQGLPLGGRQRERVPHGPAHRAAAAQRRLPDAAEARRDAGRGHGVGVIDRVRSEVPEAPGALYLRPTLFGTGASIGGATSPATEAMLVVLASPVWDYFANGEKPLRIFVEERLRAPRR